MFWAIWMNWSKSDLFYIARVYVHVSEKIHIDFVEQKGKHMYYLSVKGFLSASLLYVKHDPNLVQSKMIVPPCSYSWLIEVHCGCVICHRWKCAETFPWAHRKSGFKRRGHEHYFVTSQVVRVKWSFRLTTSLLRCQCLTISTFVTRQKPTQTQPDWK